MSDTQETTHVAADRMLDRDETEAARGRSENIIAFGAVALVSLVTGFLLGLLF